MVGVGGCRRLLRRVVFAGPPWEVPQFRPSVVQRHNRLVGAGPCKRRVLREGQHVGLELHSMPEARSRGRNNSRGGASASVRWRRWRLWTCPAVGSAISQASIPFVGAKVL